MLRDLRNLLIGALLGAGLAAAQPPDICMMSPAPPTFSAPAEDLLHALPHDRASGHSAFHGQALYGLDNLYLSHLPVFMGTPTAHPHNFQVVLEVEIADPAARASYRAERAEASTELYTVTPPPFDQTALVSEYPGRRRLSALPASTIVRGHFEQGGVPVLDDVDFEIGRVIHFREFVVDGPKLQDQNYLLFGRGGEAFAAHLLSAPPDFDQILAVELDIPEELTEEVTEALAAGLYIRLPELPNEEGARLRPGDELSCDGALIGVMEPFSVTVRVGEEIYCEAGEFTKLVTGSFNAPRRCV